MASVIPDVPTLAVLGLASANMSSLFGIYAPAQTLPAVLAHLNAEGNKALALTEIGSKLDGTDTTCPRVARRQSLQVRLRRNQNNPGIIRSAGIKAQ